MNSQNFDSAYVIGYSSGYHNFKYVNAYDKDTEAQYYIKYKMGYTEGKLLRVKEQANEHGV
jgi:hypothetical protein